MITAVSRVVVAGAVVLAGAATASAQLGRIPAEAEGTTGEQSPPPAAPRRPYRGLFEGSEARQNEPGLTLSIPAFVGYDDNLLADSAGAGLRGNGVAGRFGNIIPTIAYFGTPGGATIRASALTNIRTVEGDYELQPASYSGIIDLVIPVTRTWSVTGRQSVHVSPFYQFETMSPSFPVVEGLPPAEMPTPNRDLVTLQTQRYQSSVGLSWTGRRSSIRSGYEIGRTIFDQPFRTSANTSAFTAYERGMTRHSKLVLGYGFRESQSGLEIDRNVRTHDIDLGGAFSRPLSFSRRTTVSGSGGTSVAETDSGQHFRLMLTGGLEHEMGRTWLLRGGYYQGYQLIDTFGAPVSSRDSRIGLTGLMNRRMDVLFDATYSIGELLSSGTRNPFTSYYGTAVFRVALTRSLAARTDYSYYTYDFENRGGLPLFLDPQTRRHSVRVGFDYSISLYTPRGANAAR